MVRFGTAVRTASVVATLAIAASGCAMFKSQQQIRDECRDKASANEAIGSATWRMAYDQCVREEQASQAIEFFVLVGLAVAAAYFMTRSGSGNNPVGAPATSGTPGGD
jgi:hypothetical protein